MTALQQLKQAASDYAEADRAVWAMPSRDRNSMRTLYYEQWLVAVRRFRAEGRG